MTEKSTPGQVINVLVVGKFANLGKVLPSGSLEVRKLASGAVMFYWRYTVSGRTLREAIGLYDSSAPPKALAPTVKGFSVEAARSAAQALAAKHQANIDAGGLPALQAAKEAARRAAEAAKVAAAEHTLAALLDDYCDHLEAMGRRSHYDARNIFRHHVTDAWPKVAALPANEVTAEQVADMMRRLIDAGKGRTSNKLRSYMRAAFQTARAAKSKPSVPVRFKGYGVTHNPAADTEPDEAQNKADKNPLSAEDLRRYWQALKKAPGFTGAVLRLHLLTGGQRIEQLVRLKTADIGAGVITLYDGKGRPGKAPRPHAIPLIPQAAAALKECKPAGEYALSTDGGTTPMAATTLSRWALDVATTIPGFQTKRIRSGVETLLAAHKVSMDIRGRLQSHGISGVQARHYDGHEYLDEKREALETLHAALTAKAAARRPSAKVIPLARKRA